MPIVSLNSNVTSLKAQRQLNNASQAVSSSFEKLSSGLRINKGSDDSAGLAVASRLKNDARVFTQGIRNANDGISAINTSTGALEQMSNILVRMKELAEAASNGVYTLSQRKGMDTEALALAKEYNRIVSSTEFNKQKLLDGSNTALGVQLGYGQNGQIQFALGQEIQNTIGNGQLSPVGSNSTQDSRAVATGDFNNDGKIDIAAANGTNPGITVSFGGGDGTFTTSATYTSSLANFNSLAIADVNNDGIEDMVGATTATSQVTVFLGNADGTFGTAVNYTKGAGGAGSEDVVLADFNGDGFRDIATIATTGGTIDVLLNNGNGTFGAKVAYATGTTLRSVQTADFNGDGKLDLVGAINTGIGVLLGTGTGTFGAVTAYSAGTSLTSLTIGDFNHDGVPDVAGASSGLNPIRVLLGTGNGGFGTYSSYGSNASVSINSADITGDGYKDLIYIANGSTVLTMTNKGDGTFNTAVAYDDGLSSNGFAAVDDFNGDGIPDLVVTDTSDTDISAMLSLTRQTAELGRPDLTTQSAARETLVKLDGYIDHVSNELGKLGAAQARIETGLSNLIAARENYSASGSRILDIDVASETSRLVGSQIKQNAAQAILAQANQTPRLALDLLGL